MTIGTRSVLYGAHCFFLHPWFVALAWWRLYGFPWDPRLWVAFFVHDLGYIGKPNMDGPEGETHPRLGAAIMTKLFDRGRRMGYISSFEGDWIGDPYGHPWGMFTLLHSRYYAKSLGLQPSRLCVADKLAIALTPAWLYLPMVRATGEIHEYRAHAVHRLQGNEAVTAEERLMILAGERQWYAGVQAYCRRWAYEHADGRRDTWTSDARQRATLSDDGVWR